jgi:hypothetical protein
LIQWLYNKEKMKLKKTIVMKIKYVAFFLVLLSMGFNTQAQPSNDNQADAISIVNIHGWSSGDAAYSNVGATPDGPPITCSYLTNNVWFKFQATTNEIDIKLLTGGSKGTMIYPILNLFDNTGNGLSCHSNKENGTAFIQNISLVAGSWYYLSVDNYAGNAGTFTLKINDNVNYDLREKAELISNIKSWSSGDAAYSNVGATPDGPSSSCSYLTNNVWFKFQATTNEIDVKLLTGGSKGTMTYPLLNLFDNTGKGLSCHSNKDNGTAFIQNISLVPGSWYYLSVDNYSGNAGTYTLSIKDDIGNDLQSTAEELPHTAQWCSANQYYDNIGAIKDNINGGNCNSYSNNVWFKFKALSNKVTIKLQTGSDKGVLSNPVMHLLDNANNVLQCIATNGFSEAVLASTSLVKGAWYYISVGTNGGNTGSFTVCVEGGPEPGLLCESIYCDGNGNVGIGTPTIANGYRLSVKGKIMAEGVKVELHSKWPDYVFEKDYKLIGLTQLREFIATNGHLPNIPSAENTAKNGIDVEEMNVRLVEKIEELTLYILQLEDRLKDLEKIPR